MMLFLSDIIAEDVRDIMERPELTDWEVEYCKLLISQQAQPDQGTTVFFLEQHWALSQGRSPVVIHLSESAKLSGLSRYPVWPTSLPDQLLITLDKNWGVSDYRLPSIFVTRCTTENSIYEKGVSSTLLRAGVASGGIALEPITNNHWLISFQVPSLEAAQSGWMVSRMDGNNIEALLLSGNYADYFAICEEMGIPIDTEYDLVKAMTFEVHRLTNAIINHLSLGTLPGGRDIRMKIGGRAIIPYQITIEDRVANYEQ